jgi:class 3 adenylate cyclase
MEPRIQYARTADGVSIAFWTLGEGMPLVCMPNIPWSHIQVEWQWQGYRRWYERLAEKRKLIRYDGRGCGLSDREVADYSLDAYMLDLEAVVQRLGLDRFVLVAPMNAGPLAIVYAARHPERVLRSVLWCGTDFRQPRFRAFRALREGDWDLYMETLAHAGAGWSAGEEARRTAAFMRECAAPEAVVAAMAALWQADVTPFLSQINSPTLVLHRREVASVEMAAAKAYASGIPGARLVLLEGDSVLPWVGDMEAALQAIDDFLGEGEEAPAVGEPPAAGAFRTVLFTDVEGSTALTQRLGDAKARAVLREHERIVREALRAHGGAEVKALGDGFMASFSSATRALECAIAMQMAFAEWNEARPSTGSGRAEQIKVRIGLNAGEPIAEEKDLFGTAVNLAARIAAKAEGGEILASDVVRQLVAGKGFLFADRGGVALRGFEDPVRLYEVRWGEPV